MFSGVGSAGPSAVTRLAVGLAATAALAAGFLSSEDQSKASSPEFLIMSSKTLDVGTDGSTKLAFKPTIANDIPYSVRLRITLGTHILFRGYATRAAGDTTVTFQVAKSQLVHLSTRFSRTVYVQYQWTPIPAGGYGLAEKRMSARIVRPSLV